MHNRTRHRTLTDACVQGTHPPQQKRTEFRRCRGVQRLRVFSTDTNYQKQCHSAVERPVPESYRHQGREYPHAWRKYRPRESMGTLPRLRAANQHKRGYRHHASKHRPYGEHRHQRAWFGVIFHFTHHPHWQYHPGRDDAQFRQQRESATLLHHDGYLYHPQSAKGLHGRLGRGKSGDYPEDRRGKDDWRDSRVIPAGTPRRPCSHRPFGSLPIDAHHSPMARHLM